MRIINWLDNFIDYLFNSKWSIYIILIITALIVLPNIGRESLWLDEIFSANATLKTASLNEMFSKYIVNDVHPPLYYIILYYWGKIFSASDVGIRLLSYAFTILGLILSYLLLLKYFTRRVAIIFLSLSAFTPGVLYFAQEARMYALLYALACLASVLFLIFIKRIKDNQKIEKKLIIYYFLVGVLACYTHFFGYIIIFSISSVLVIYSFLLKRNNSTIYLIAVSSFIGIIGIIWLFIQYYYGRIGNNLHSNIMVRNNIKSIILNFSTLFAANKFGVALLLILLTPFLIKFSHFLRLLKVYIIILLPVLLLFLTAYIVSLKTFTISERYLIVTIPLILLFIAFIFNELFFNRKQYILLYLIGLLIISTYKNYTYKKQNWRDASKYIENKINSSNCKVPIKSLSDGSFDRLAFVSYYLGPKYTYSSNGPEIQENCDLIYIDGHTNEEGIRRTLVNYNISIPYEILNFNKVYVVIKKRK